jgi:ribosomal-protein-alanine N-acetyltransferase
MRKSLFRAGIPAASFEPMTLADVKAVAAIERQCFSLPWTEGIFTAEVQNVSGVASPHVLRSTGGEILGYLCVWNVHGELHINNLAVAPHAQGRGWGGTLLDCAEDLALASGCSAMSLEVRVSNEAAVTLYEKHGFTRVGLRKRYYEDTGEDALVMARALGRAAPGKSG